jgi:phage FluMu gp28-like protein
MSIKNKYFMQYQIDWLNDTSRIKIWEKSRRIGATYCQSYEDVRDCAKNIVPAVWFSSADESAAKEYILYCAKWAKMFDLGARDMGEVVIDKEKDIKGLQIVFSNGNRITALTSNPRRFRSKGGKIVLDEFAHHEDQVQMWKAAKPSATWGFPIRIMSTHQGKKQFYKFLEAAKKKKLTWSVHTTDIYMAVNDGLVDKILQKKTTEEERKDWLKQEEQDCFDPVTWQEEYCCNAQDESDSFIDYELIGRVSEDNVLWEGCPLEMPFNGKAIKEAKHKSSIWVHELIDKFRHFLQGQNIQGNLFLGFDIARRKDLSCIWVCEKIHNISITRAYIVLENCRFWVQEEILYSILSLPELYRACIDETGIGIQLAERAQEEFGTAKVEAVNFASGNIRTEMAFNTKREFEDRTALIPDLTEIKDDIHSIKKVTTSANNIRLLADSTEDVSGHADRFWGLSLCLHAGQTNLGPIIIASRGRRKASKLIDKY